MRIKRIQFNLNIDENKILLTNIIGSLGTKPKFKVKE